MTQHLNWPNKAKSDPHSLWNVPASELMEWYEHIRENKKRSSE